MTLDQRVQQLRATVDVLVRDRAIYMSVLGGGFWRRLRWLLRGR